MVQIERGFIRSKSERWILIVDSKILLHERYLSPSFYNFRSTMSTSNSTRIRPDTTLRDEMSPINTTHAPQDVSDQPKNYSTFQNDDKSSILFSPTDRDQSLVFVLMRWLSREFSWNRRKSNNLSDAITWRVVIFLSLLVALVAYSRGQMDPSISPAWKFDYNVYIPNNGSSDFDESKRISLITQVAPSKPLQRLVEISSRPNRAYARLWGIDYTRYDSGRRAGDERSCFDKIFVLKTILDKQNREHDSLPTWVHSRGVEYDSIILLPPDSIITDLDTDLFDELLPTYKLAAIAGWDEKKSLRSTSDVVVFNMNHEYADPVAQLWWQMAKSEKTTCGANNDLGMLVTAIASVMNEEEDLNDLIEPLLEDKNGFIGDRLIKSVVPTVPESRSTYLGKSVEEKEVTLYETADSVCYRFYPKCEVL